MTTTTVYVITQLCTVQKHFLFTFYDAAMILSHQLSQAFQVEAARSQGLLALFDTLVIWTMDRAKVTISPSKLTALSCGTHHQ